MEAPSVQGKRILFFVPFSISFTFCLSKVFRTLCPIFCFFVLLVQREFIILYVSNIESLLSYVLTLIIFEGDYLSEV